MTFGKACIHRHLDLKYMVLHICNQVVYYDALECCQSYKLTCHCPKSAGMMVKRSTYAQTLSCASLLSYLIVSRKSSVTSHFLMPTARPRKKRYDATLRDTQGYECLS